jgi:Tol biopolymer transport system component
MMKVSFRNIFILVQFFVIFLVSIEVSAQELSIENIFPQDGMTVGGTVPILADMMPDSADISWRVYDTAGTIDKHGYGASICLSWNTRLIEGNSDTIIIEACALSQCKAVQISILINPLLSDNPLVTQMSFNLPDSEKIFCGGNLHRGSERVSPNKKGNIVAFMSNSYTEIPVPIQNKMPICQNCEIFINTPNGKHLTQLTSNPSDQLFWKMERVDVDDLGEYIVFTSSADLLGTNPQNMMQLYYLNAKTGVLRQLTSFQDGEFAERCSISGDGYWVAFNSNTNQLGTNPEHLKQVFVINRSGSYLQQLTFGADGETRTPVISGDGRTIAFESSYNLTGENPNHMFQIYVIQRTGAGLRQLTFTNDKHNSRPAINRDGTKVVFLHHRNEPLQGPIGLGADVISINTDGTNMFQYTNISEDDIQLRPDISEDGNVIAWESTADLTGRNKDKSREIYVCSTNQQNFRQITNTISWRPTGWKNILCQRPYLNEVGSMVYFECTADLTGDNPDLWIQVFSSRTGF